MKVSQLISALALQMSRSGDLDVVIEFETEDGDVLQADVEEVIRIGNGPISISTGPVV